MLLFGDSLGASPANGVEMSGSRADPTAGSTSPSTVPEPGTALLAVVAGLAVALTWLRKGVKTSA